MNREGCEFANWQNPIGITPTAEPSLNRSAKPQAARQCQDRQQQGRPAAAAYHGDYRERERMRNQTAGISDRIDASDGPRHAQLPVEKFTARSLGTEMTKSKRDHGNPCAQFAYRFPDPVVVPQLVEERRKA